MTEQIHKKDIKSQYLFGIDLGTTTSQCSYYDPYTNKVEIFPLGEQSDFLKSAVKFIDGDMFIGRNAETNYKQGMLITESKRLIGRKYYTISQQEKKTFNYQLIEDGNGFSKIIVNKQSGKMTSPTQIATLLFKHIVEKILMMINVIKQN